MRKNKLNTMESLRLVGPSRPQDIIKYDPRSIVIEPVNPEVDKKHAYLKFTNTYYKCGNHHIFVNETFDSHDAMRLYTEIIRDNASVHIFLNDRGTNIMGLLAFCDSIAKDKDRIRITVHLSKECDALSYIELPYFQNMIGYFRKCTKISPKFITSSSIWEDFWCGDWFDWDSSRDCIIQHGTYSVQLQASSNQIVNGISVRLGGPFIHGSSRKVEVYGIKSRFIPGFIHVNGKYYCASRSDYDEYPFDYLTSNRRIYPPQLIDEAIIRFNEK